VQEELIYCQKFSEKLQQVVPFYQKNPSPLSKRKSPARSNNLKEFIAFEDIFPAEFPTK
jgi:hypothetical protein